MGPTFAPGFFPTTLVRAQIPGRASPVSGHDSCQLDWEYGNEIILAQRLRIMLRLAQIAREQMQTLQAASAVSPEDKLIFSLNLR